MIPSEAASEATPDRPYAYALLTLTLAATVTGLVILWSGLSPELVLIGLDGQHDAREDD